MLAWPDRSFGNRGTLWTGVPTRYQDGLAAEEETHYVGGTTVGIHVLANGAVALVTWGWTFVRPWETSQTTIALVRFPVDGAPREYLRWDGTDIRALTAPDSSGDALASCSTGAGAVAVLVREAPPRGRRGGWSYGILTSTATSQQPSRSPVAAAALFDPSGGPTAGTVRLAADGAGLGLASSRGTRVRVTRLAGGQPVDVDLANSPALPGLARIEVASVRFDASGTSLGLTAFLNHPGVGPTSVAAVVRLRPDGSRDPSFAANGLWASPLALGYRDAICAAELGGMVAGCIGRRAVVFAVDPFDPGGSGLDFAFAGSGIAEQDLGGPLASPVAATDGAAIYVFAQRVPSLAGGSADLRTAGCRFRMAPGTPEHGTVDPAWAGGTLTIRVDGGPFTPAGLALSGSRLLVGGTRQIQAADLDRMPTVVEIEAATGDPVADYGAGGFALHGSIQQPAIVRPDGSAAFVERSRGATGLALRMTTSDGSVGPLVPLTGVPADATAATLTGLADGSLLVAGGGAEPWVCRLDPQGAVDAAFGTAGLAKPKPGMGPGTARVLGIRASGDAAIRVDVAGASQLALLRPDGSLDTAYGTNGYVDILSFTHPGAGPNGAACFLDADGSVIMVVSSEHEPVSFSSPWVAVALRRVTAAGAYDAQFGLGAPSVAVPAAGRMPRLITPNGGTGGDDEYSSITPVGIAWMGGRLYVVATGWSGGRYIYGVVNRRLPRYPFLLVLGWTGDGAVDPTFSGGRQEAGFSPDRLYWGAAGILQDSPSSTFVFGIGGEAERVVSTLADGTTVTNTVVRQPQPALFRLEHPTGIDRTFGTDGAALVRLQEMLLSPVAGALVGGRVRAAYVDALEQPVGRAPQTNVGGLVQWALRRRRPIRPRPVLPGGPP